jgi:hypothetical protein
MITEQSLLWSLKHLRKFGSSDLFPKGFEFTALSNDWEAIKNYILGLNIYEYTPKSPVLSLCPKADGTFRIVHDLDPLDALIYTALIYAVSEQVEEYRIPESENIACSYRIKLDLEGSFFAYEDNGWSNFRKGKKALLSAFQKGYILKCDIADFYNQIYIHRIRNIISETGKGTLEKHAKTIEDFLLGLNTKTSQGIPVGPAASIILAEVILSDIDRKLLTYTRSFVRWVDDFFIFCESAKEARWILHELTKYLYSTHRLFFNAQKTKILPVEDYIRKVYSDEEETESTILEKKKNEVINKELEELFSNINPYAEEDEISEEEIQEKIDELLESENFTILSDAYFDVFKTAVDNYNYPLAKHILRKATKYRIRNLFSVVVDNFETLLPVIREVIRYMIRVVSDRLLASYEDRILNILSSDYSKLPFVNMWLSFLLRNPIFNKLAIPEEFLQTMQLRDKILLFNSRDQKVEIKHFRDGIDVLGPMEKRAAIYSLAILSNDERAPWLDTAISRGDITEKAVAKLAKSNAQMNT